MGAHLNNEQYAQFIKLRDENERLRAALKIARQWMPVNPYEMTAKADCDKVDAALRANGEVAQDDR